jgi:hypothetical protein
VINLTPAEAALCYSHDSPRPELPVAASEESVYGWRDIAAEVADYLEISNDEVVRMFWAAGGG